MSPQAYCSKHDRTVQLEPPRYAPYVLNEAAVRELLTGCVCGLPSPEERDVLWAEIREHLADLEDEVASGAIQQRLRMVRWRSVAELVDADIFARILRGAPLSELLDPDDPRNP